MPLLIFLAGADVGTLADAPALHQNNDTELP